MSIGPTPVQTALTNSGSAASVSVTFPTGVTAGNLVIAYVMIGNLGETTSNTAGSLTKAVEDLGSSPGTLTTAIWYGVVGAVGGPTAGTTIFTFAWSGNHSNVLHLEEWPATTGWASSPLNQTAHTNGGATAGTAFDSGATATTTQGEELWVALHSYKGGAQTLSGVTAGWTNRANDATGTSNSSATYYQVASATGTARVQATVSTAVGWAGAVATFKSAVLTNALATQAQGTFQTRISALGGATARGRFQMRVVAGVQTRARFALRFTAGAVAHGRFLLRAVMATGARARFRVSSALTALAVGARTRVMARAALRTEARGAYALRFSLAQRAHSQFSLRFTVAAQSRVRFVSRFVAQAGGLSHFMARAALRAEARASFSTRLATLRHAAQARFAVRFQAATATRARFATRIATHVQTASRFVTRMASLTTTAQASATTRMALQVVTEARARVFGAFVQAARALFRLKARGQGWRGPDASSATTQGAAALVSMTEQDAPTLAALATTTLAPSAPPGTPAVTTQRDAATTTATQNDTADITATQEP